jgi:hypothetical protein
MTSYEHEPIPNGFMQTAYGCFKAGKLDLEKSAKIKGSHFTLSKNLSLNIVIYNGRIKSFCGLKLA